MRWAEGRWRHSLCLFHQISSPNLHSYPEPRTERLTVLTTNVLVDVRRRSSHSTSRWVSAHAPYPHSPIAGTASQPVPVHPDPRSNTCVACDLLSSWLLCRYPQCSWIADFVDHNRRDDGAMFPYQCRDLGGGGVRIMAVPACEHAIITAKCSVVRWQAIPSNARQRRRRVPSGGARWFADFKYRAA